MTQNYQYNHETERKVIASCITYTHLYYEVQERLVKDLFTNLDCIRAYEIIQQLVKEGKQPEITEVSLRLIAQGGDISTILLESTTSYDLLMQYIDFLNDLRLRRKMIELSIKVGNIANDPTSDIDSVNSLVEEFKSSLTGNVGEEVQSFGDVTKELLNDIAQRMEDKSEKGMMTGLRLFDSHHGWHRGDLIILAGETSQGKSTLATTIAKNMAKQLIPIAYYSMEMSAKQLAARIMAEDTLVSSSDTLYAKLGQQEYTKVFDTTMAMKSLPIYFDERSKVSFTKISLSIRKMVKNHGVKVVFIDYLQILANGGRLDSREQIIGDMARDLKRLAVELDICIVALSQMARASGKTTNEKPSISRLRGSGQIEEAADIVILIWRPKPKEEMAQLFIAKGRNIGLGSDMVKFCGRLSYFADYETGDPSAPYQEHTEKLPF